MDLVNFDVQRLRTKDHVRYIKSLLLLLLLLKVIVIVVIKNIPQ